MKSAEEMDPITRLLGFVLFLVVIAVSGVLIAMVVGTLIGLPIGDIAQLVALSFGPGLATLAVGLWIMSRMARRRPGDERGRAVVVAVIPVIGLMIGAMLAAYDMFVSSHDLQALSVVVVGAGTAGVMGALVLARELALARQQSEGARQRQQRLEQSRRELVAWVSHDLRTPLAGIRAMSEALVDGVVDDAATVERYHQAMHADAEALGRLVDDLFELSRIQIDALQLSLERVSLGDLVSDAIASATAIAELEGVELVGEIDGPPPLLDLSSPEMLRVVRNLLDNAIRHTRRGGEIVVRVSTHDGSARLVVFDECGGIAADDLGRVFDLAYRGDRSRSPSDSGGGLGLTIARGLVEAHGGTLSAANHASGCCFTVDLPMKSGARSTARQSPAGVPQDRGTSLAYESN